MKMDELQEYTKRKLYDMNYKNHVYKYILDAVEKKLNYTLVYKNKMYCPICKTYHSFINLKPNDSVYVCPNCKTLLNIGKISSNRKNDVIVHNIFSFLDYEDGMILHKTYTYDFIYKFNNSGYEFISNYYPIGLDVWDIKNPKMIKCHYGINIYNDYWGHIFIWQFADDIRVKKIRDSIYNKDISYHRFENIIFKNQILFTNKFKDKFLKYLDINNLEIHFYRLNIYLVYLVLAIIKYPKLETIYKNCICSAYWNSCYHFFRSVYELLINTNSKIPEVYELFKNLYEHTIPKITFDYYFVNAKLGKPYIDDYKIIGFLHNKSSLINRKTVNYLLKQKSDNYRLYQDYLSMLKDVNYPKNVNNLYPKDFVKAHDDLSLLIASNKAVIENNKFSELNENYDLLSFQESGFNFYLPRTVFQFKQRGSYLSQCLFSMNYYNRVLNKKCIIVFIDSIDDNSRDSMFTLELSMNLEITQLHGFANDVNCNSKQRSLKNIVKKIIDNRLNLLTIDKGVIKFKNDFINFSIDNNSTCIQEGA